MKQVKRTMTVLERIRERGPELSEKEREAKIRAYKEGLSTKKTDDINLPVPGNLTAAEVKAILEE